MNDTAGGKQFPRADSLLLHAFCPEGECASVVSHLLATRQAFIGRRGRSRLAGTT